MVCSPPDLKMNQSLPTSETILPSRGVTIHENSTNHDITRMKNKLVHHGLLAALAFSLAFTSSPVRAAKEVPNFMLLDDHGKAHEFHRAEGKVAVLFFTGVGCPVVRKSASKLQALKEKFGKDVSMWVIDSEAPGDIAAVQKEKAELGLAEVPVLMDSNQALALSLGVERTAEVVAVDTKEWSIVYRGAIDDQLAEGAEKPVPEHNYLQDAVEAYLAGKPVTTARTTTKGCLIAFEKTTPTADAPVSYTKQIAPLLREKCVSCHRDGEIGPFSFSSYAVAKRKARMIEEVLLTQRMPPWSADPHFGKFADAQMLTTAETQSIVRWVEQGAPQDAGADPLAEPLPPLVEWPLGKPDYIVKLPHPEEIPATGVLDYRHIRIPSPIHEDVWLGATVVKPGNRKVVHHAIIYAQFPGMRSEEGFRGVKIAGWAPGRNPVKLPTGTGVFLGKDATLNIEIHYTTNGTAQTDDTEIGLYLQKEKPALSYRTGMAIKLAFKIPAFEQEARTEANFTFKRDSILYTLTPHMHVRGSYMKYEAIFPDGNRETLLSVPRYDFNWQTSYRLAQPRPIPAGTKIICSGAFDNSKFNLANPDPSKDVYWGEQSWDEMFIGYVGYAEVPPPASPAQPSAAPAGGSGN
jgi:peroxiredoxin